MTEDNLVNRLSALGLPLFKTEQGQDVNATLADVVKSRELRFREGFPVVFANTMEKGMFNYEAVKSALNKPFDKSSLRSLILMSLALYRALNLKFSWVNKFYKSFSAKEKKEFNGYLEKLKNNDDFSVAGRLMSSQRLKSTFNDYFSQAQSDLADLLSLKDELSLEYALSYVFSPKQKELFLKKFKREKLTKTEKEYFSRVVKKKVLALANAELHRLAQKLLQ